MEPKAGGSAFSAGPPASASYTRPRALCPLPAKARREERSSSMQTIFTALQALWKQEQDAVLAAIVTAGGSTPRGAGSLLLAGPGGLAAGTIGGGPGEAAALELAARLLHERTSQVWDYELRHGGGLGSVCGGDMTVLFQFIPHDSPAWRDAAEQLTSHQQGWLLLSGGDPVLLDESGKALLGQPPAELPLTGGCTWNGQWAALPLPAGDRVVIFGGGHCALALVPVLRSVGFRVAVYDDRPEFSSSARFPEAETTVCGDYTGIAAHLALTDQDYAVVMTSGHSHDFEVQAQLLRRPLAYIGVMGSKAKTAYVNRRLKEEAGLDDAAIQRVHTPIGTAIRAVTPEEIAVSITGELICQRAQRREAAGGESRGCPSHL